MYVTSSPPPPLPAALLPAPLKLLRGRPAKAEGRWEAEGAVGGAVKVLGSGMVPAGTATWRSASRCPSSKR